MTTNDKNTQRFIVKLENAEFLYALSNIPVRVHVYKRAKLFAFVSLPSISPPPPPTGFRFPYSPATRRTNQAKLDSN